MQFNGALQRNLRSRLTQMLLRGAAEPCGAIELSAPVFFSGDNLCGREYFIRRWPPIPRRNATRPGNGVANPNRKSELAIPTATNKVLCDTMIGPDGSIVVIEDAGTSGVSGTYVHADIDPRPETTQRALWVHTMSSHECDLVGRRVRVRVLCGDQTADLGDLAFDGHLNIASGLLSVGDRRNPDRQILVGPAAVVPVSIFVGNDIDAVRFDDSDASYPLSGPSEITVLLHGSSGHTYTLHDTTSR